MDTTPTRHSPNAVLMLDQRLRRWPNIEPTLEKCTMFERTSSCPANPTHLYNIYINSYKCFVFTGCKYKHGVSQFRHPRSNTVSLFASKRPSRGQAKGFELLKLPNCFVYFI